MDLSPEQMQFLADKGLSLQDIIEFAEIAPTRSSNAERQSRYRARKRDERNERNVTRNVTPPLSRPPNEINSNPPTHTPPDNNTRARKVGQPDGVSDDVWRDFVAHRKAKRSPITETALARILQEAGKAGWTLEAALTEAVARGWTGFKASWVDDAKPPGSQPASYLEHLLAKPH